MRAGPTPEVERTTFEASTDGVNWLDLGAGVRSPGGWQLTGMAVPTDALLRARGFLSGGGSDWFVDQFLPTAPRTPPWLLTDDDGDFFPSNRFSFHVAGGFGHLVVVEGTTNFANWMPLETNRLSTAPHFFSDPGSTNLPRRFYRARLQ